MKLHFPKDHFVIPCDYGYLFYVPLKGILYLLNKKLLTELSLSMDGRTDKLSNDAKSIVDELNSEKIIKKTEEAGHKKDLPNYITLDLSTACNLSCVYCYAESGEKEPEFMTFDCAKSAIDLCVEKLLPLESQEDKFLYLIFHGGSEPTSNWGLFINVIDYSKELCKKKNIKLMVSLSTNGFYSEEKANWLVENVDQLSLSLDGYEKIQNLQRPTRNGRGSFETVFKSAKIFLKSVGDNFSFGLRPTVTNFFVDNIPDIIEFFSNEFPDIGISVEPAQECGRCKKSNFGAPAPHIFVEKYCETLELHPDVDLNYSGFNEIGTIRQTFCSASEPQFAVLPSGLVTACYGYSLKETHMQDFVYGQYSNNCFVFDEDKIQNLRKLRLNEYDSCSNCFAKYNCAGDCPSLRISKDEGVFSTLKRDRCIINRGITKWHLIKEVKKHANVVSN